MRELKLARWNVPLVVLVLVIHSAQAMADGKLVRPRDYKGSLEEKAQEAVIIFQAGGEETDATEDLILKISVEGKTDDFAWVVPFPKAPKVEEADSALFEELFKYVESRRSRPKRKGDGAKTGTAASEGHDREDVEVISREVVGSFDVAVVKENTAGKLNEWLTDNGYQSLDDAEDVLGFYREKGYVYACIRVSDTALGQSQGKGVDLHPLRFTFETGGSDGIYFPMKLTGLQSDPFDVNLYVFYGAWLNDRLNKFGYTHQGFELNYRDWDSPKCEPNAGKTYSEPEVDPFLKGYATRLKNTKELMQKLHPGEKFYLTNIQAYGLKPENVRKWKDDLWLFPYYTNKSFVPFDARPGGAASAAWPNLSVTEEGEDADAISSGMEIPDRVWWAIVGVSGGLIVGFLAAWLLFRRQSPAGPYGTFEK